MPRASWHESAERTNAARQRGVVRHERAGISRRPEILPGIEAECRRGSGRARIDAGTSRAVSLARVLEDRDALALDRRLQGAHIGHLAVEMDGKHRARPRRDLRGSRSGVDAIVGLEDVDDDWARAGLRHSFKRRHEGHGRNDDLVSRLDSARDQAEPERIEPASDTDALGDAAVLGKRLFEALDVRPVREGAGVEEVRDVREQVSLQRSVTRCEIEKRDADARL